MKKLLLVAFCAILVAGCAKKTTDVDVNTVVVEETGAMVDTTTQPEVIVEETVVIVTGDVTGDVMTGN